MGFSNRGKSSSSRFEVGNIGIYAAVENDCPKDDSRREKKPDGSWLPRVGMKFPGAISFWTEVGLDKYTRSGLRSWHESVVTNEVEILEIDSDDVEILYQDELQVIGSLKSS